MEELTKSVLMSILQICPQKGKKKKKKKKKLSNLMHICGKDSNGIVVEHLCLNFHFMIK